MTDLTENFFMTTVDVKSEWSVDFKGKLVAEEREPVGWSRSAKNSLKVKGLHRCEVLFEGIYDGNKIINFRLSDKATFQ